jgi:hypothetical protein
MKPKAVPGPLMRLGATSRHSQSSSRPSRPARRTTRSAFEAGLRTRSNRRAIRSARVRRSVQERWTGEAAAKAKRAEAADP